MRDIELPAGRQAHSRLRSMAAVAWLIRRHLPNVLTYLRHRITNASLEAVNATIQWVKKQEVVVDGHIITPRVPSDLPAFLRAILASLSA